MTITTAFTPAIKSLADRGESGLVLSGGGNYAALIAMPGTDLRSAVADLEAAVHDRAQTLVVLADHPTLSLYHLASQEPAWLIGHTVAGQRTIIGEYANAEATIEALLALIPTIPAPTERLYSATVGFWNAGSDDFEIYGTETYEIRAIDELAAKVIARQMAEGNSTYADARIDYRTDVEVEELDQPLPLAA